MKLMAPWLEMSGKPVPPGFHLRNLLSGRKELVPFHPQDASCPGSPFWSERGREEEFQGRQLVEDHRIGHSMSFGLLELKRADRVRCEALLLHRHFVDAGSEITQLEAAPMRVGRTGHERKTPSLSGVQRAGRERSGTHCRSVDGISLSVHDRAADVSSWDDLECAQLELLAARHSGAPQEARSVSLDIESEIELAAGQGTLEHTVVAGSTPTDSRCALMKVDRLGPLEDGRDRRLLGTVRRYQTPTNRPGGCELDSKSPASVFRRKDDRGRPPVRRHDAESPLYARSEVQTGVTGDFDHQLTP